MSARQSKLVIIAQQEPVKLAKGDRTHNPRQIAVAAVNKGKTYPYASTRQNTREVWRRERWNARRDVEINAILGLPADFIAAE